MNDYNKKSFLSLLLFIVAALAIASAVICLSKEVMQGGQRVWIVINSLISICAVVLGLNSYLPKK